jgi:hypothetical protein
MWTTWYDEQQKFQLAEPQNTQLLFFHKTDAQRLSIIRSAAVDNAPDPALKRVNASFDYPSQNTSLQ